MLLLIGGVFRTGKSLLARRLMLATAQPYLGLDVLKMALAATGFAVDPEGPTREVAAALWPLTHALCTTMAEQNDHYIIEGELPPAEVAALCRSLPARAVFLGYPRATREAKLADVRRFGGHANDWPTQCSDEYMRPLLDEAIAYSATLESECASLGLAFFDTSADFTGALDGAASYLSPRPA